MKKVLVGIAFAVVVLGLMLYLIGTFEPKVEDAGRVPSASTLPAHPLGDRPTAPVRRIVRPREEWAVGTVKAVHETAVASKILAKVIEVRVTAGQAVSKGDILVRLDDRDLSARLAQAKAAEAARRAARDQARIEAERVRKLYAQHSAPKIELDRAETALKTAEAELERAASAVREAETLLGYATIRSPLDGIVVDKRVDVGDMVVPGQVLLTLYDPKRMQLVASVRESLSRRLRVGQPIDVKVDALDKRCRGVVSEIVPEAETPSRAFSVKVTGPCPPGVYSGMFGRIFIPLDEETLLVIPRRAVRRVGQLTLVEVVEGKTVRRRAVRLGRAFGDDVEVLAGLREGERVVVDTGTRDGQGA